MCLNTIFTSYYLIGGIVLRIFFFLFGFGLMVVGFTYVILYLNLLTIGYNFLEYVNFICSRVECYFVIIGLIILVLSIFIKGEKEYELYI